MNQWWVDDLPLPLPHTTYKWARDHTMLVTLFSKYLQMVGKSFEPPQCKCYKGRNKLNSSRTSWVCQLPWLWTIVARRSVLETTSSRASTSPVLTTGALFFSQQSAYCWSREKIGLTTLTACSGHISKTGNFQRPCGSPWGGVGKSRLLLRSWPEQRETVGGTQEVSALKTF